MLASRRLDHKTLSAMFRIYCRGMNHDRGQVCDELCPSCLVLLDYSLDRTASCKWKKEGRLCSSCPVHCFEVEKRKSIAAVMRYSGPRLMFIHPLLSLRYLIMKICNH